MDQEVKELCKKMLEGRLTSEELEEESIGGFGGNTDDAFSTGEAEGKASLAQQILNMIEISEIKIKYHVENFDGQWWYVDGDCQKVRRLSDKESADLIWGRRNDGQKS